MALHYQTEYRLGNRGRICRSYTGFQALLAIAFDLVFGLLFELVALVFSATVRLTILATHLLVRILKIHWKILVAGMTLLVYLLTLPFAMIHEAVNRLRSGAQPESNDNEPHPASNLKPSWELSREV